MCVETRYATDIKDPVSDMLRVIHYNEELDSANILLVKLDYAIVRRMVACFGGPLPYARPHLSEGGQWTMHPQMKELLVSIKYCKKDDGYYHQRRGHTSRASGDCHAVLKENGVIK